MLTGALRPINARFVSSIIMICLLVGVTSAQAASPKKKKKGAKSATAETSPQPQAAPAKTEAPVLVKEWGPYLDVAYELTYWDKAEIKEWREKRDKEIGETLLAYITVWNGRLTDSSGSSQAVPGNIPLFKERDYLRLAIAQTVEYLESGNLKSLEGAAQTIEKLKSKEVMPEIAFWTGFVKALQALENNDSLQFVSRVYDIWNNAVMFIEQGPLAGKASAASSGRSAPYHYRNIVYLVVNRAIIDRKMADLNALGPLFLMLRERDMGEKGGDGQYFTSLVQRIGEGFEAPDSDRYRLNFTVAMIEAKRLQQVAAAKLDAGGMSEDARKVFEQSRLFDDYALAWAASPRSSGAVVAVIDYLDFTSFAIQRLADNEKAPAYQYFALLPAQDGLSTLRKAMAVFNDVAAYSDRSREKAGYANRELYLKAMHRLWRAIMELSLWTGDYYLTQLNTTVEPQKLFKLVAPMQVVLNSYLDFLASQKSRGFPDVIPDFAYFGGAEAAEKLAYAYLKTYTYSTDTYAYNLWFLSRLQAAEMFPLNTSEITQTASILQRDGRYNLFLDYFFPLAERFRQSAAVKKWLEEQKSDTAQAQAIREYVGSIYVIFTAVPDGNSGAETAGKTSPFDATFRQLREDLQRKPDHPVHKLLKAFYVEEMEKTTSYTLLLKDPTRLNR